MLDASQEGFRRHHSTLRQAQSLAWDHEEAKRKKIAIYSAYIDFRMAFNSMDQEAMWQWLKAVGLHPDDLELLRKIKNLGIAQPPLQIQASAGALPDIRGGFKHVRVRL